MPSDKKLLMICIIMGALVFIKSRTSGSLADIAAVVIGA